MVKREKKETMHFALVTWTHESKKIKLRMGSRNGVRVAPVEIERQEVRWHSRVGLESPWSSHSEIVLNLNLIADHPCVKLRLRHAEWSLLKILPNV